jgi:hypothetical protein
MRRGQQLPWLLPCYLHIPEKSIVRTASEIIFVFRARGNKIQAMATILCGAHRHVNTLLSRGPAKEVQERSNTSKPINMRDKHRPAHRKHRCALRGRKLTGTLTGTQHTMLP